jgi:hypothetical protein
MASTVKPVNVFTAQANSVTRWLTHFGTPSTTSSDNTREDLETNNRNGSNIGSIANDDSSTDEQAIRADLNVGQCRDDIKTVVKRL